MSDCAAYNRFDNQEQSPNNEFFYKLPETVEDIGQI